MAIKLAYMIQAHKGENQIVKLINILRNEETDFFIHIDKKNDDLYRNLKERYMNDPQVLVLEDRTSVNWSGFSQVQATLKLMDAVRRNGRNYDYVNFLSGQDFPIKSPKAINEFLSVNYGKEFIEYKEIDQYFWRLQCYNFLTENKRNRTLPIRILDNLIRFPQKYFVRRKNLNGFHLYYGSTWFTITYNCMNYILNYLEHHPEYLDEFKYTSCSDEHFFQILILNSDFKQNVVNNNLRYIDWSLGESSPKVLTVDDFEDLKATDHLFARKFELQNDAGIIECIEQYLGEH